MSTTNNLKVVNLPAGSDFNGDTYCTIAINSSGRAVPGTASTDIIVGVLAEDPGRATATDGSDTVAVALTGGGGLALVKIGEAVTAGEILVGAADGEAAGVADLGSMPVDSMGFGIALESGADGDIIRCMLGPMGGPHSA